MFALNHPTPFDFPQRPARAPKLLPHCVLPRMSELDFWRPQDRNRSHNDLQRTELPFYVLQSHKDQIYNPPNSHKETDQFSLSNFPQELELDVPQRPGRGVRRPNSHRLRHVPGGRGHPSSGSLPRPHHGHPNPRLNPTTFDTSTYDVPNSLPQSTAAEISWLRGNDQQDFLKDDFELTSPHLPPTSNTVETDFYSRGVETDFYSRGVENSFPAAAIKSDSSKSSRACVKRPVRKAVDVELEEGVFPEVCLTIHSKYKKAENSSEFILQVKKEIRLPGNRTPMAVTVPNLDGYMKVHNKHTPGKKPKLKARWTLMCNHCGKVFCARPTPKNSRYVVNHICPTHVNKRKQFVIGTKARRCEKEHEGPCIQQLLRLNNE